jgi:toxin ParE1/3/4
LVRRIRTRINRLEIPGLSHIGRPGLVEGTRELLETPYIIVYMVDEPAEEITVLAIVHGARDREA